MESVINQNEARKVWTSTRRIRQPRFNDFPFGQSIARCRCRCVLMSTNQRFSNRNQKTRRIGWLSATQNVPFPSAASRKCRKIGFAFAIQPFVDCAHYFINLMKHFMHCWEYFSYIFSILLSSWFMLSSSAFYIGLLWLSLHAQSPEQDHKTYRWFRVVLHCITHHKVGKRA